MNGRIALIIFATLAALGAQGADSRTVPPTLDGSNPYSDIADKNIFRLNPEPPPEVAPAPKPEIPMVKITGFVRNGRQTRALFVSEPKDKKEAPTYFDLAEGERQGFLELVRIHLDTEEADVINSGVPATLSFKEDSLTPSPPGPPAGGTRTADAQKPGGHAATAFFPIPMRRRRLPGQPPLPP